MNKKILIVLGVLVVLILGVTFPRGNSVIQQVVGAVSGPDISSPYISVNGVETWYATQRMTKSTTTPCALRSPIDATSTLLHAIVDFRTSSTTAMTVTLARATTAFGTTTLLNTFTSTANMGDTIVASTTGTESEDQFPPGTYFTVGLAGNGSPTNTFTPVGSCSAEWRVAK